MYNLLLVDDEPNILNGIYQNIDWYELDIEYVFKAGHAADALAILEGHHIDLVITDIKMPEMDGVKLVEIIRARWPYAKILFLTGHQDFHYAQAAVDLNVSRYLLKPIPYDELKAAAADALGELKAALGGLLEMENMRQKMKNLHAAMRERHIYRLLELGDGWLFDHADEQAEYAIPLPCGAWGFFIAMRLDGAPVNPEEAALHHVMQRDLAEKILCGDCRIIDHLTFANQSFFALICTSQAECHRAQELAVERLSIYQGSLHESLRRTVTIFWGDCFSVRDIHGSYIQIKERIDRYISPIEGCIIAQGAQSEFEVKYKLESLRSKPSLADLIRGLQREEALRRVEAIFRDLSEKPQSHTLLLQVYHEVTGALVSNSLQCGLSLQHWARDQMDFFENINSIGSFDDFRTRCLSIIDRYMEYMTENGRTQTEALISSIRSFIRDHLSDELSVALIASQFSYHPNYISRVFKRALNRPLQEYIIEERIAWAKQLLLSGNRVSDIAEMVGYGSIPHFSRIFKKVVGVSPRQFQQSSDEAETFRHHGE